MVSVLIPAHNEERHIAEAIESALHQKVSFSIEIIVVDDGSTDRTADIASSYATQYDNVHVIRNEANQGKGYCTRLAYNSAQGRFVHILDADDVFSNWDKIQRQVDILLKRTDCFAVAHNSIFHTHNDLVKIVPGCTKDTVYSYQECYRNKFYCHTSSYLFRRLDAGLPDYFDRRAMRGDTALFFYHCFTSKKSVYVMKETMSVYNIHGQGIWTGLDENSKTDLNISVLRDLQSFVVSDSRLPEYKSLQDRIDWAVSHTSPSSKKTAPQHSDYSTIDDLILQCERTAAKIFRPEVRVRAFQAMYSLPVIDALMETIGRAVLSRVGFTLRERQYNNRKVALLVSGFVPNGGGVFNEIRELVRKFVQSGFHITILNTDKVETDYDIIEKYFSNPCIAYRKIDTKHSPSMQIDEALRFLIDEAPDRIYPFITHHDVVGLAIMQRGLGRAIVFDYVFDHGLSLGVHCSAIDQIIVKTHNQASALAAVIDYKRLKLLAPFFNDQFNNNPYRPLRNDTLTTASAAARSYKVESKYRYQYFDIIILMLSTLNVKHVHYGPLSIDLKEDLLNRLRCAGVGDDRFVHIPWADDFGGSLLENGVDLFIAPFPICSARIGVEVMCCGIPSINHRSALPGMPEAGDFADPEQLSWKNPEEFINNLSKMSATHLDKLSDSARKFFCDSNTSTVVLRRFVDGDFDDPVITSYPRFSLSDLALEPFFNGSLVEDKRQFEIGDMDPEMQLATKNSKAKFWYRTPRRRRMRALFHSIRKSRGDG